MLHGPAAVVEHAALDDDALPDRFARMLTRQVVVERADELSSEDRAGQLGQGLRDDDERPLRMPQRRGPIRRRVGRRMDVRLAALH